MASATKEEIEEIDHPKDDDDDDDDDDEHDDGPSGRVLWMRGLTRLHNQVCFLIRYIIAIFYLYI